ERVMNRLSASTSRMRIRLVDYEGLEGPRAWNQSDHNPARQLTHVQARVDSVVRLIVGQRANIIDHPDRSCSRHCESIASAMSDQVSPCSRIPANEIAAGIVLKAAIEYRHCENASRLIAHSVGRRAGHGRGAARKLRA